MQAGVGPVLPEPLNTKEDLEKLVNPDFTSVFDKYYDAIYLTRHSL